MPQFQQTKGDGENPKEPAAESEQQPQDLTSGGPLSRQIQQDLEAGVGDDPVSFLIQHGDGKAPSGDDRGTAIPPNSVEAQGPQPAQVTADQGNNKKPDIEQLFEALAKGIVGKFDKLLSRDKLSPDCRDGEGRTPLIGAAEAGSAALAGVAIRHGADVNAVDPDGETALMKAAFGGHLRVAELLVENGADLGMRNNDGSTALEIAQVMKRNAVVAFLAAQAHGSTSSIETETSTDPHDDGPASPSAAASVPEDSQPEPKAPYRNSELIRESGEGEESLKEGEFGHVGDSPEAQVEPAKSPPKASLTRNDVSQPRVGSSPMLPDSIRAAGEEKIIFDEWDNRQIRSINEKVKKVLDKAGREIGNHTIDTVFKGSHMAVLKPRSQEYKRFRKLWKHQELLIDPRRWREWTGEAAVGRYCLGEGIDISPLSGSHLIELYSVKDLKMILTLAEEAISRNYTIRQLKAAIEETREQKDDLDPGKVIIKTLDQSVPILDDPDLAELCTDKERVLQELSKAERKKIRSLIKQRKPSVDEWKDIMDTLEGILSDLEDE